MPLSKPSGMPVTCLQQEKTMTFITVFLILENLEQLKEHDFLASKDTIVLLNSITCVSYSGLHYAVV